MTGGQENLAFDFAELQALPVGDPPIDVRDGGVGEPEQHGLDRKHAQERLFAWMQQQGCAEPFAGIRCSPNMVDVCVRGEQATKAKPLPLDDAGDLVEPSSGVDEQCFSRDRIGHQIGVHGEGRSDEVLEQQGHGQRR